MLETLLLACGLLLTMLVSTIGLKFTILLVLISGAPVVSVIAIIAFLMAVLHFHHDWGLLIAAFGPIAFLASGAIGGPLHLSIPAMLTICFGLWSAACLFCWLTFDRDANSRFFGASFRFWGFGLIVAACIPGSFAWHAMKSATSPATEAAAAPQQH